MKRIALLMTCMALAAGLMAGMGGEAVARSHGGEMEQKLDGMKVAVLIAEGFHDGETLEPIAYLRERGAGITILGPEVGEVQAYNSEVRVEIGKAVGEVQVEDYDALVLPGGIGPSRLREHEPAVAFTQEFVESGKPVAAICHGPQVLVTAGVVSGRRLTAYEAVAEEIREAGGRYVDVEVARHGNIITSRTPPDLPAFNRAIAQAMWEMTEEAQGGALPIGARAPEFRLRGVDGEIYSREDFEDKEVLVLVVSCNHCPVVVQYEDRMVAIQRDYAERGVQLVAINGNETDNYPTDDFENMVRRAQEKGFNFPYLRDDTQDVLRALRATRTPQVFVFGPDRRLVYQGRIDDNANDPEAVNRRYLREALEEILAGEEVAVEMTQAVGCTVKWWGEAPPWMP